ncbi:hypothetical protein GGR57DRAFT_28690 [Xylariaceae sp. FL1272]|nr:hypothetical protein GGR57DRAFT_28690 [Xylariaceae sp. FL1272]
MLPAYSVVLLAVSCVEAAWQPTIRHDPDFSEGMGEMRTVLEKGVVETVHLFLEFGSSLSKISENTQPLFWWSSYAIWGLLGLGIVHCLCNLHEQLVQINKYQAQFQEMWAQAQEREIQARKEEERAQYLEDRKKILTPNERWQMMGQTWRIDEVYEGAHYGGEHYGDEQYEGEDDVEQYDDEQYDGQEHGAGTDEGVVPGTGARPEPGSPEYEALMARARAIINRR